MVIQKSLTDFPKAWTFGNYLDQDAQTAYLGIHYPMRGKQALRPLVLALSDCDRPNVVANALIDCGSDFDGTIDVATLKSRLARPSLVQGIYTRKMGVVGGGFITANGMHGHISDHVLPDPVTLKKLQKRTGTRGSLADWEKHVARRAYESSYCMFAIMQALAASILGRVFEGGDEGFLINLAGDSSRGKTTVLQAGQSVIGAGDKLSSWDQTYRSMAEEAAAFSDILLAIDDLDKMKGKSNFMKEFPTLLHMLVSGDSKLYSEVVKGSLPDLNWQFCGLTCARKPFAELAAETGNITEANIRVRCLDMLVPSPEEGGIWDRYEGDTPSSALSDQLKVATSQFHGALMPSWLDALYGNPAAITDAKELIEYYCEQDGFGGSDGISTRVNKKFGLVYAAGILAEEAGLIAWPRETMLEVVQQLNRNSLSCLYEQPQKIRDGIAAIQALCRDKACPVFQDQNQPCFDDRKSAEYYVSTKGNRRNLNIMKSKFDQIFRSNHVAQAAREILKKESIIPSGRSTTTTFQRRISIGRYKKSDRKIRYMKIDIDKLLKMGTKM